ncbi:MAG TPA: hypothetical protein VFK16_06520 [Gemmatimonadaceae bacterium]|jgi:hypothetical protein|nr:hypothetical protein [Gemmatimonadaceae bacterium]
MKATAWWALVSAAVIVVAGVVMALVFPGAAARHALIVAGVVVFIVHQVSFALVRRLLRWNVLGAWVIGSTFRFATLAIFAFLVAKVLLYPLAPALIGCAVFLFLPVLLEPLLLLK